MTTGDYRVYLWRYVWARAFAGDFTLWKIGCTGMPEMDARIRAWSGWLGMTSAMTRALAGVTGGWVCEHVAVSDSHAASTSARRYEADLHARYAANSIGHELFTPHPDFGPDFFGDAGRPADPHPLLTYGAADCPKSTKNAAGGTES